jgi:two-component system KDP operon response regulator KdpE
VLRRSKSPVKQASLSYGPLSFKSSLRQVFYGDKMVTLTKTEGAVLFELMEGRGAVVSSADMVKEIWGQEYQEIVHDIKTYIYRLRKKLEEDPRNPKLILTAPGEGYYLAKYD